MSDQQYITTVPSLGPVCVDVFGGGELTIQTPNGSVLFEWSDQFGPLPITKAGAGKHLSPRHPFWRAASLWNIQGRRVDNGKAIWHEPKQPILKHMGGRNYLVIEDGEEGHDW